MPNIVPSPLQNVNSFFTWLCLLIILYKKKPGRVLSAGIPGGSLTVRDDLRFES